MKYIALDIETSGLNFMRCCIWSLAINDGGKVHVFHNCNGLTKKDVPVKFLKMIADPKICKIIHRSIFDAPFIRHHLGVDCPNIWDSENLEVVIQGMRFSSSVKNISPGSALEKTLKAHSVALKYVLGRYRLPVPKKEIREQFIDRPKGRPFTAEELKYMADDVTPLLKLQQYQEVLLKHLGLWELALMENLASHRYADIKYRGIGFSKKIWGELADFYGAEYKRRMAKLPNTVANWGSEKQVKEFFKNRGVLIESYSQLDSVYLKTRDKVLGDFMVARELKKAVDAYGWNWFQDTVDSKGKVNPSSQYVDPDDRVRCDYTQSVNTGRNSALNPNLQQLPGKGNTNLVHLHVMNLIRSERKVEKLAWRHREAFIPAKGKDLIDLDFGGQEIGIMAAMAGEDLWINAMLRGEDVHALTAYTIDPQMWRSAAEKGCTFPKKCKCPEHQLIREPAKINNFRLAYGGGAESFAAATGRNIIDATAYVAAHRRAIPHLIRKLESNGNAAIRDGVAYSADPYKRRFVLTASEKWQFRNMGKNYPIQGAGANMLKLTLASLPMFIPVVCVIHDQIIVECPKAKTKEYAAICKKVMEDAAAYITGIKGLIKVTPEIKNNIAKN